MKFFKIIFLIAVIGLTAKSYGQTPVIIGNNNDCDAFATYSIQNPVAGTSYYWSLSNTSVGDIQVSYGETVSVNWYQNQIESGCNFTTLTVTATDANNNVSTASLEVYPCCTGGADNVFNNFTTSSDLILSNCTVRINGDFIMNHNVTFNNVLVSVSPNSKIKLVADNIALIVDNSTIGANFDCCQNMWDGIYTKLESSQDVKIINSSIITNAQHALIIERGVTLLSENAEFLSNYKNIYVYDGCSYVSTYDRIIRSTSFIGSNSLPNYPYQGMQTYSGVEVWKTNGLTIGDPANTSYTNTFENMFCGIKTDYSGINIYNNQFSNIHAVTNVYGSNPMQQYNSTAIFSIAPEHELAYWLYSNIGGDGLKSNHFKNCYNGIYAFNVLLTADNNTMNVTNYGIEGRDLNDNSVVTNNNIMGSASGNDFVAEGIRIVNIQPHDSKITVVYNTINAIRRGIFLSQVNSNEGGGVTVGVNANTIKLTGLVVPFLKPFSGIEAQGCYAITINNNNLALANTLIPTSYNLYYGINIAQVRNAKIGSNANIALFGAGINVSGNCNLTQFYCNILDNCYYGFMFNSQSSITTQGLPNSGNTENVWVGNYYNPDLSAYRKLWGINSLIVPTVRWCIRNNPPVTMQIQNGDLQNPTSTLIAEYINPPTALTPCRMPHLSIMSLSEREELYGKIVSDSNVYAELQEQYKAYDKEALYKAIKQDPSIINMGDTTDVLYQAFYAVMQASNIKKIDEIEQLIKNKEDSLAMLKNAELQDVEQIDQFRKIVNEIYLSTFAKGNYDLSPEQIEILYPIATDYTPWEGGDAVYIARNMLNLDDEAIRADYAKGPKPQPTEANTNNAKLYPNPAKDEVIIELNSSFTGNAVLEIYGFAGNLMQTTLLNTNNQFITVSTKSLQNGVYFYRIIANDEIVTKDKLVIIK